MKYLLLLLAACDLAQSTTSQEIGRADSIYDPALYGAIPDDGVDDRAAFQSAVNAACVAGGEVRIGPGTYDFTRATAGSYNRFAAISWHCANVSLKGSGEYLTTLKMSGDQGNGTTWVIALDPGASGSRISDLNIDTVDTYNTDEQFHAIAIGTGVGSSSTAPPVTDITVERIRINHPIAPGGARKGDCLHIFGNYPNTEARNIKILDLNFAACARSGVGIQRNSNHVLIRGCYFNGNLHGATMLDGEATGGDWDRGLIVQQNTFYRTIPGGDTFALTLTSQSHYTVTGNLFFGRGMSTYRSTDGVISTNVFEGTDQLISTGVLEAANITDRLVISNNVIRRKSGAIGMGIKIQPHSGALPGNITISNNQIFNEVDSTGIHLHSPKNTTIQGNTVVCTTAPNSMGIYAIAGSQQINNLVISGNNIENCTYAAVRLPVTASYTTRAILALNMSLNSGPIKCDNWNVNPGNVISGLNNWSNPSLCPF